MAQNTLGHLLRLTTFGESHGLAIGGVIDGLPAGIRIDFDYITHQLLRRATGAGIHASSRTEDDVPEILSGVFEGQTIGTPLAFIIRNRDARSGDYAELRNTFRPSHADLTYTLKYGIRDHRGGGRSSARETATWVTAGAIMEPWLKNLGISIVAYVSSIGEIEAPADMPIPSREEVEASILACPHTGSQERMLGLLQHIREAGDSIGGVISARITGLPSGLGEPVFGKFHALLGQAMLSIPAVKGVEFGEGFKAARLRGGQHNDPIIGLDEDQRAHTSSNHAGGLLGGISNGEDLTFRIAFKPVASIALPQTTINSEGKEHTLKIEGRHDACPVPRAVPVVESLAALVTADLLLQQQVHRNSGQQNAPYHG